MSSLLRCSTFQTGKLCRIHKLPKTKKKATSKSSSSTWGCSKADSDVASDESMGWFKNTRIMRLRFCHFDSSGVTHNSVLCRSHWMSLPLFSRSSQDLWLSTLGHSSNKEETQYIALFSLSRYRFWLKPLLSQWELGCCHQGQHVCFSRRVINCGCGVWKTWLCNEIHY